MCFSIYWFIHWRDRHDGCQIFRIPTSHWYSGPRLNIKTVFPRHGDSHVKDRTVTRPSYLWHGDPYTDKTSLYWDSPLVILSKWCHKDCDRSICKSKFNSNLKRDYTSLLWQLWLSYNILVELILILNQASASYYCLCPKNGSLRFARECKNGACKTPHTGYKQQTKSIIHNNEELFTISPLWCIVHAYIIDLMIRFGDQILG